MIRKIAKLSLRSIFSHKMRSFLTMLGIIIGVMAVVILVSITQSATTGITDSISSMGSQQIAATVTGEDVSLSRESVESLAGTGAIEDVAPVLSESQTARHKEESGSFTVAGVTPSYFTVQDLAVQSGRLIVSSDLDSATSVAVLGTEAAYQLFGTWDAVGGTVTLGDRNYKVVGVLEEQGSSLAGSDDSKILIPYTTAQRATGQKNVTTFYAKATSEASVSLAVNTIDAYLLQATRDEDVYTVSNQSDLLDTMDEVDNTLSLLLGGIAAISLLVGGHRHYEHHAGGRLRAHPGDRHSQGGGGQAPAHPGPVPLRGLHPLPAGRAAGAGSFRRRGGGVWAVLRQRRLPGLDHRPGRRAVLRGDRRGLWRLPGGQSLPAPAHRSPAHPVIIERETTPWEQWPGVIRK